MVVAEVTHLFHVWRCRLGKGPWAVTVPLGLLECCYLIYSLVHSLLSLRVKDGEKEKGQGQSLKTKMLMVGAKRPSDKGPGWVAVDGTGL